VVPVQTQEAERHRACRHVQHDLLVVGEPGPANLTVLDLDHEPPDLTWQMSYKPTTCTENEAVMYGK